MLTYVNELREGYCLILPSPIHTQFLKKIQGCKKRESFEFRDCKTKEVAILGPEKMIAGVGIKMGEAFLSHIWQHIAIAIDNRRSL